MSYSSSAPRTIPTEYLALSLKLTQEGILFETPSYTTNPLVEELNGIGEWAARIEDRANLAQMMARRRNIVCELGSTEHTYVDQLNALNSVISLLESFVP